MASTVDGNEDAEQAGRKGSSTAHCEGAGGCGTRSSVGLGDEESTGEVVAEADVDCAARCTGSASSATDAGHKTGTEKGAGAAATKTAQGGPESATNGRAECTVSGGGCSTRSQSSADDEADSRGSAGSSDAVVEVDCEAGCTGSGTTSTAGSGRGVTAGAERTSSGTASCESAGSGCQAYSTTEVNSEVDEQNDWADRLTGGLVRPAVLTDGDATASSSAGANVDCDDAACGGKASSATTGTTTGTPASAGAAAPVRTTKASSSCEAKAGGCGVESDSQVSDRTVEPSWDEQFAAAVTRKPLATRELSASSAAGSEVGCAAATCAASGSSTTSGGASGDVKGVRDSTGTSSCTARGAGGSCSTAADTTVADRDAADADLASGVAAVSGPVSVSHANASVECSGAATACGGTASSSTSARDTGVSPHARGTSATTECTVTGGGCSGETSSSASSAPDFVAVDPNTGKPLPGQSLSGPSSTSSASASLACEAGTACSGSVRTTTSAWDGAVAGGKPRTSEGTASCTGGTGGCEVRSVSTASTGPGAALALSGPRADGAALVNTARLVAGPSAASAAGASLVCEGQASCTGTVTSAASAMDPSVSAAARGSRSEGSCEGVSGGVCQAVTNSGASSGPDANVIAPLVQARSTANATVTSETTEEQAPGEQSQEQPAVPPAPTAPGSSANSGAPTVPGASSWTMVAATLDCAGSTACTGTVRSSAAGSDGPTTANPGNGARGPPEGVSTSSATCTSGQSACQAQTNSTAGSGQVVADIVAEQQNDAAKQAEQQAIEAEQLAAEAARVAARKGATAAQQKTAADAAKVAAEARKAATEAAELAGKPVTDAPAALSQSSAMAECTGPGCTAATTGATSGVPGESNTTATCTAAASGCVAASEATTTTGRDSGQVTGEGEDAKTVPGISGMGQATSQIVCPEAGCTGSVTGTSRAVAGPGGQRSVSTATGDTRCDGTTVCQAQISVGTTVSASPADATPDERFASTNAWVSVACDNGSAAGCATRASSESTAVGADGVRASATATCAASGTCTAGTGGSAAKDFAEVTASCAGTGCTTHTEGRAEAASPHGTNTAVSRSDCTAAAGGECASSSRVAASAEYALAGAGCAATDGSSCSFSFRAESRASGPGVRAEGVAGGHGTTGTGEALTSALVDPSNGVAQASASCSGTGVACSFSFRAESRASGPGVRAEGIAAGHGTTGSGQALTSALVDPANGVAQASASCSGTGVTCSYSYRAESHAAAPGATAHAVGFGSGGLGGGYVATSASAESKDGFAQASASCQGSAGTDCSHHWSVSVSDHASHPSGSWAYARASDSGGGAMGASGGWVFADASVDQYGNPSTSVACSNDAHCSKYYAAHIEFDISWTQQQTWEDPGGIWNARRFGDCSGTTGNGCGLYRNGNDVGCTGDCSNFRQSMSTPVFTQLVPSGKEIWQAQQDAATLTADEVAAMGPEETGSFSGVDENGDRIMVVKDRGEEARTCDAACIDALPVGPDGTRTFGDAGGAQATWTPDAADPRDTYGASVTVSPTDSRRHEVGGEHSARISQDAEGDTQVWMGGRGRVTDGRTGASAEVNPTNSQGVTTLRIVDRPRAPFDGEVFGGVVYHGPEIDLPPAITDHNPDAPGFDELTSNAAWVEFGATKAGQATFRIAGTGRSTFVSAEGVVVNAYGDGANFEDGPGNNVSLITPTYGPDDRVLAPGIYDVQGQTGDITLPDGRKITNHNDRFPLYGSISEDTGRFVQGSLESFGVKAITELEPGRGGSFHCVGFCTETVPGNEGVSLEHCKDICTVQNPGGVDPTQRACSEMCEMHDEFGGDWTSKYPAGYFQVRMIGDGNITSFTPEGDPAYCGGEGCRFTQGYRDQNGNYGFMTCHLGGSGGACLGETMGSNGQVTKLECRGSDRCNPVVLLYPNKTDPEKYGLNEGWSCGSGVGVDGCVSNREDLRTEGRGEVTPGWMPLIDPGYRREYRGTEADKMLAEILAPLGYEEGDPLPPLDAAAYANLTEEQRELYDAALRPLTDTEKDFASARAVNADADNRYDTNTYLGMLPELEQATGRINEALQNGTFSPSAYADELALIEKANIRAERMALNRGIANALTTMQYQRPFIDEQARSAAEAPNLPADLEVRSLIEGNTELQEALGVNRKGQPLDQHGNVIVSNPEEKARAIADGVPYIELTPTQKAQSDASRLAGYALIGHQEDLRRRTLSLEMQVDWLLEHGATQADVGRVEELEAGINADSKTISGVQVDLGEFVKNANLPGVAPDVARLREFDIGIARNNDEPVMAGNLERLNAFQTDLNGLVARLSGSDDPQDKALAETFGKLASVTGLSYDTVAHDSSFRDLDGQLVWRENPDDEARHLLSLPSSGRADMVYVFNSAINSPGYYDYAEDKVREFYHHRDRDEIANWASEFTAAEQEGQLSTIRAVDPETMESLLGRLNEGDQEKIQKALEAIRSIGGENAGAVDPGEAGEVGIIQLYIQDPNKPDDGYPMETVLFRVRGEDGTTRLVDAEGGIYDDWRDYQQYNSLADDQNVLMAADLDAEIGESGRLHEVDGHEDPAWKTAGIWVGRGLMVVGGVALIVSGVGAPLGAAALAATASTIATVSFVSSAVVMGATAGGELIARGRHNQDTSLSDPTARSLWITAGASLLVGGGSLVAKIGALKAAGAVQAGGTAAAVTGGVVMGGQMVHSTYTAIRDWETLSPAQRREFWIDTSIGALGLLGGGVKIAGNRVASWRQGRLQGDIPGINQQIMDMTALRGGRRPSVGELSRELGISRSKVRFALQEAPMGPLLTRVGQLTARAGGRPTVAEVVRETGVSRAEARAALRAVEAARKPEMVMAEKAMARRGEVTVEEFQRGLGRFTSKRTKAEIVQLIKDGDLRGFTLRDGRISYRPTREAQLDSATRPLVASQPAAQNGPVADPNQARGGAAEPTMSRGDEALPEVLTEQQADAQGRVTAGEQGYVTYRPAPVAEPGTDPVANSGRAARAMGGKTEVTAEEFMAGLGDDLTLLQRAVLLEQVKQGNVDGFSYSERVVSGEQAGGVAPDVVPPAQQPHASSIGNGRAGPEGPAQREPHPGGDGRGGVRDPDASQQPARSADEAQTGAGEAGGERPGGPAPGAPPSDPVIPGAPGHEALPVAPNGQSAGGKRPSGPQGGAEPDASGVGGGGNRPAGTVGSTDPGNAGAPGTMDGNHLGGVPPPGARRSALRDAIEQWRQSREQYKADWQQVRGYLRGFKNRSYDDLTARSEEVAQQVQNGERSFKDGVVECVAIACEVARRVDPAKTPRKGQIMGAVALARDGRVVEMLTGEGKTLTGAVAIVARRLLEGRAGGQVQWLSPNESYAWDAYKQVKRIAKPLGLTVELDTAQRSSEGRAAVERAHIKMGALSEEAFGALRDRNGGSGDRRAPAWRLLDEVDQLLLDDVAPFILSEQVKGAKPALADMTWAKRIADADVLAPATRDNPNGHYHPRTFRLTEAGREWLDGRLDELGGGVLGPEARAALRQRVENALKARNGLKRDVDYLVEAGEVVLLAEDNRPLYGRRLSDGLHEAVELKELGRDGVRPPSRTIDSITVRELLAESGWAGMTGTVGGKAGRGQFRANYDKLVVHIEPFRRSKRVDHDPVNHRTAAEARHAALADALEAHAKGFPVLIRVGSVAEALIVEGLLWQQGVIPRMITAKAMHRARESEVIAHAGRRGAVTVATDMAGRARDIKLGGSVEALAAEYMTRFHPDLVSGTDGYAAARARATRWAKTHIAEELALLDVEGGGLHVIGIGTPRNARIEGQLRGRSGRNGQHGVTRIHRSWEDRLVAEHAPVEFVAERGPAEVTGRIDGAAADAVFDLVRHDAEVAANARLAAASHGSHRGDHLAAVLSGAQLADLPALPANPAGVDLHHLEALRGAEPVPGLTAEQYLQAREDALRFEVEHHPASQEHALAADRLAALIPARALRERPMTPADVERFRQHVQQATDVFVRETELADLLGMGWSELAAAGVVGAASQDADLGARGAELTANRDWGHRELADALAAAAGLPPVSDEPITAELLDELRTLVGLDRFAILRGEDPATPHASPHHPGVLVAHAGIGPVRAPAVNPVSRTAALMALDELVRAGHGDPQARTRGAEPRREGVSWSARVRELVHERREAFAAGMRRRAAVRELRSVLAGLDEPVRAGRSDLAAARAGLAAGDTDLAAWQRAAVRWLFAGPDAGAGVDGGREAAVARLLGVDRAEVRLYAADRAVPVGAAGLGEPTGSFEERMERLTAELAGLEGMLRAAADGVDEANRVLVERQAERTRTLEAAVRAAAAGGVPVARIAGLTGLTPERVRAIVGERPGRGSGPSATGGGPVTGGGGSNPTGTGPERPSTPPAGSGGGAAMRTAGPRAAEPEARSRGPPWWKRLFTARTAGAVVLFTGGLVATFAAARYGVAEPGAFAAAGVWWWPGRREAVRKLREDVSEARARVADAETIEAIAQDATRRHERELQVRLGWVAALAERLRQLGRTDDQIVDDLAGALAVHPQRVRARLTDPDLTAATPLPAPLAAPLPSAAELLTETRRVVTARSADLGAALAEWDGAARALARIGTEARTDVLRAAREARDAGVRPGTVRRATGLSRADIAALPASPPTLRDAAHEIGTRIASGWGAVVDRVRGAGRWVAGRWRAFTAAVGARALAAVGGLGRGWRRFTDRVRAGRVLRAQIRGVARLRAVVGVTARLLQHERRAAARAVTTEQLGWIGWLAALNAAQPGGRLTAAQLAQRIAGKLGLPERTVRRMLARAVRRGIAVPLANGVGLDLAIARVQVEFFEAHPTLADALAAHRAAERALVAGRAEAVERAVGAGVATTRAARRMGRAAAGRGSAGYRARLRTRLGLDVPVTERLRTRRVRVAGYVVGAGAALVAGGLAGLVGAGAATVPVGSIVAAAGLLAAARAMWMPKQARGPPWKAFAAGLRAHAGRFGTWALGGAGAVLGAGLLVDRLDQLWPVFVDQPGLLGVKALLVPLVTAGLVFRYVLRRQYANQASGMQTRPRLAAWGSAVAAYVLTAGFGLVRAFQLVTGPWWLVPIAMAIAVGITNAILQKKDTGRTRVIKALVSGSLSAAVTFVLGLLGNGLAPGAISNLINAVVIATFVYASPTVIAEYVNVWVGRLMAPYAKRKAQQEQKNAAAGTGDSERQRRWYIAWLDYRNFSPVDTRLLWRKALDPVLAGLSAVVINLAWVERAWVLANDNSLAVVLARFAVMATSVWLVGKLWRDPDEFRNGFYGFRSSRSLRKPSRAPRWTLLTGGRMHHRVRAYQRDLNRVLGLFDLTGRDLDRGLAHDLAEAMWARMTSPLHEPLTEWEALPDVDEINDALARERGEALRRREHHVETVELVVPILAADPAALKRVADRLRRDGRVADAEVLDFQRMLSQELWARFTGAQPDPAATPAPSSRVWAKRMADALEKRNELRSAYLEGPRRELLELIKQHYLDNNRRDNANLRRARAALRALEFQLRGVSTPRREPLEAVAQLAEQRARSVRDGADTEKLALAAREPAATRERLAEKRQLEAGMRLVRSAALLAVEAEHSRTQRSWDRERRHVAMTAATRTPPNQAPATLLERLLLLAGRRGPATPDQLQARYGGTGWADALAALAETGALEGDATKGYRATAELTTLWREAGPRLRHAMRSDAAALPGGAELAPLTVNRLGPAGVTAAERDAVAALRDVLRDGRVAFGHWQDGWLDDFGGAWRRLAGIGYVLRHGAGRRDWPLPADHPAAPIRFAAAVRDAVVARWRHRVVPGQQRRLLRGQLRRTDAADRLYFRALRAGEFLADQRPGRSLRPEATDLLHAARGVEVEAYARLAEARERAAGALGAVGSYPHQVDRTLRPADEARPHAPDSDPLPPPAEYWLREITKELAAATARLDHLHSGPEREAALAEARLLLKRHDIDRDYAWATQLYRTMGGWNVMEKARLAAKDLRSRHEEVVHGPASAPAQVRGGPVVPHRDWVAHPHGDDENAGQGMAAATRRGLGNRTNQDAAALVTLRNGDRVALVVDGVFSYPDSQLAAIEFATAFRAELIRTDRAGRGAEQALRDAHQAGLDALTMRYTPESGHGAVAYLAAYHGTDGKVTTSHVGTARAYFVPITPGQAGGQLTVDHSRGGDITEGGIMTRWAAGDYRPEPTITPHPSTGPGLLVLATDGLWRYLPTAGRLAEVLTDETPGGKRLVDDPAEAAARLAEAARAAGGRDDLTVAVMVGTAAAIAPTVAPSIPGPAVPGSGAIAVTVPDAMPVALTDGERAAAEQAVRELHHARPGALLDPGGATYRRADPRGRWAAHGVRVYALPGLRRRFDQLTRPGDRELALLYFVTEDHAGVRSVFVDPATLAAAERLPRSARALIAERELVRVVDPGLPEPAVQAMPLPSPRRLRRLAARPYELGAAGPRASDLGDLIVEHLATTGWRESPARLARRLGVDEDAVHAAVAAHPQLVERFLVRAVLGDAVAAGFRRAGRDGHPALRLTRPGPDADRELYVVGRHYGPDRHLGLDPLANAVHHLDDLRHLHRAHEPVQWRGVPTFELVAAAWRAAGAPIVQVGDLRVYRGAAAGAELTLVTWRGELVNLHLDDVTAVRPEPVAEALASVVRITGQVGAFDATATGVVVAPETVLTVAHAADVDPGTLQVDGLPVTAVETRRTAEFGAYADLAARSVASAAEAGAPLADGLVDLALLTVPGLRRPAARLRATPVPVGTQLAIAGHPAGRWLVGHGPVRASGVHLTVAAPGLTGASGGPALDADGAVAGIQSYGHPSGPADFIGSELVTAFLATVRPGFAPPAPDLPGATAERPGADPGSGRSSHTADRRERRSSGVPSERAGGRFVLSWRAIFAATVAWVSLEVLVSLLPGLRGVLPEPFDLFSHAKNLKGGAPVAVVALVLRLAVEVRRSGTTYLTRRQLRGFRRYWVPGVMAVAAFVNALTETRWGLELVGDRLFPQTTPDPVDLAYSVFFGGAVAALAWRRDRTRGSDEEPAEDALVPAIARAKAGLRAAVADTQLSIGGRWAARRELRRGLERYWGRAGIERNLYGPVHLDPVARSLRERAGRVGVQLSEAESVELALRLLYWGTATAPYAARSTESARRRAVDVGTPVRDAVTAAFARLLPEPLRAELELDRRHLHEVGDALRGGAVALTPMTERQRREVVGRLPAALRGSRPVSGVEFPNLARGPPEGVALVRIVEDDLGDGGSLIAFGWRDPVAAPDGVIAVPARVARVVEALIAADPAVAGWWARLLHHELDFHINGDEHTGPRHDADAAPIAAEWSGRLVPQAPRPMTGAGGARSPPPGAATVWIWREKGMPRVEFWRKATELLRLGDAGQLHKARNPVARDPSVTRRYTADLVKRITTVIGPWNPEHAARLVRRVTELMDPDHVHELQLGGKDVAANIRMLDRLTNRGIGSRQLRPQLMSLPDGTPVWIDVLDITDLGGRISTLVGDGTLTYRRLMDIFGLPKAVLRGAVRQDDTLREVGRKHAVGRVGSRDEQGSALRLSPLSLVGGLAAWSLIGGWEITAATVLGLAAISLVLIGIKAVVGALRRRNARAAPGTDTGDVVEQAAPVAPQTSGPPGARKPPGSHMPEEDLAPALRGAEMTFRRRDVLAAALSVEVRLPGERTGSRVLLDAESLVLDRTGRFGEWVQRRTRHSGPDHRADPRRVLSTFVLITRRLLLDDRRLRRLPIPPPVWRDLDGPVEDPTLRPLAVDAGFRWEVGRLQLFVTDAGGAVHEVVESTLAAFAGFPDEARHAVAVLAERAADPTAEPGSWLTTRTLRDLDRLARENPAALDRLIADHQRVLGVDIDVAFAGLPAWRDVARTYVEQFREAAVARIPHRDVPRATVDHEAKEALRELRMLVRELPGFTRAHRRYVRGVRPYWNDEVYEGVIPQTATRMKRAAARHRLDVTDAELLALAARWNVWGKVLGLNVPDGPRALVEQVWQRLLPAELREEFPLFP